MNHGKFTLILAGAAFAGFALTSCVAGKDGHERTNTVDTKTDKTGTDKAGSNDAGSKMTPVAHNLPEPGPIDPFMTTGIDYLVKAQHEDGGWGGGSHSAQDIRDPHAVKTDPGSTSFAAMALMRAGHLPFAGEHAEALLKATKYVVGAVEQAKEDGPLITDIEGTQLQTKLGRIIDTSMASQFLSRVLPYTEPDAALQERVEKALDKCIRKIEISQGEDGSWTTSGWAPVLQSSMNNQALELAGVAGRKVNEEVLDRSREYQRKNVNAATGEVVADAAAGVRFYAGAAAQRAAAKDAVEAEVALEDARREGKVEADAKVTAENLEKAGYSTETATLKATAYNQNQSLLGKLNDEGYLSGFGNNGGEEFISYMLTSESIVITGGDSWEKWNKKMHTMFEKIQNKDGSWSGHHCITSPVICTSAAILCLTADRDTHVLLETSPLMSAKKK